MFLEYLTIIQSMRTCMTVKTFNTTVAFHEVYYYRNP